MANGYMPRADFEAFNWMNIFAGRITDFPDVYHVAPDAIDAVNDAVGAFRDAYKIAIEPQTRTASAVNGKDTARANAELVIRAVYNQIKMDRTIGDDQKIKAGVRPINSSRSRISAPSDIPTIRASEERTGVHVINFSDPSSPFRVAKPAGAVGLQLMRFLGDHPAQFAEELTYFTTITRNKTRITYTFADDLKIATYMGRWITRKGEVGMWSKPVSLRVSAQFAGIVNRAAA